MVPWKHEDRSSTGGNSELPPSRFGIGIRINSFGDGSHSWCMIGNGLNKYVTEMSEEIQENRSDEIAASVRGPAAKARPKQTSLPRSSSPTLTKPLTCANGSMSNQESEDDQMTST